MKQQQEAPFTMTSKQIASRYSISTRTLATWRMAGMPCLKPSCKKVLFIVSEVDAWVKQQFGGGSNGGAK